MVTTSAVFLLKQTVPWNSSGDPHWNAWKLCTHICSLPAMAEASIKKAFPSLLQHLSAASKCQYYPQWEEVGSGKVGSIRELIATRDWELGTLHALCCRDPALSGLRIYRATLCVAMIITGNEFMATRRYSSRLKECSLQFINNRSLWNKTQKKCLSQTDFSRPFPVFIKDLANEMWELSTKRQAWRDFFVKMSQIRNNTLFEAALITNLTPYGIFVAHQKWMLVRNSLPHPKPGKAEHWISLGPRACSGWSSSKVRSEAPTQRHLCLCGQSKTTKGHCFFLQNDSLPLPLNITIYQNISRGYLLKLILDL